MYRMTPVLVGCLLAGIAFPNRPVVGQCNFEWARGFYEPGLGGNGLDGQVYAMIVFDDGTGPALYAGGDFTIAGGVNANRIARWDGAAWSALGSGLNGSVRALTVFDDGSGRALYAGGGFTTAGGVSANYIARWDGTAWSALGTGMNDIVSALTAHSGELIAGGAFATAGGSRARRIARWNGVSWSPLGLGTDNTVFALVEFDDGSGLALYATGLFTLAGDRFANRIAKWDGSKWFPLGSGLNDTGLTLAVFSDELIAGGLFTAAGGVSAWRIAKWDGATWSPLGSGIQVAAQTNALSVFDDGTGSALYAGGVFRLAGGADANNIARWDGVWWSPLGGGLNNEVRALAGYDDGAGAALYAGGNFTGTSAFLSSRIAKWSRVGSGSAPEITQHPDAKVIACCGPATFTVAASGATSYQWRRNGLNLRNGSRVSGATAPTLTIDSATCADAGTYDVVVSNSCGSVTSAPATLTVQPGGVPGDMNGDGVLNGDDVPLFVAALLSPLGAAGRQLERAASRSSRPPTARDGHPQKFAKKRAQRASCSTNPTRQLCDPPMGSDARPGPPYCLPAATMAASRAGRSPAGTVRQAPKSAASSAVRTPDSGGPPARLRAAPRAARS